ncbi:PREDICTED: exocyst complex component EXO70A1-like [Nicotiana attenuata]|uniref:Exocyst subunit Exo70 family protein n=1 Tax=Nicotiana attenuata TaxID=49451 RepID=A0A314LGC8_NICAT|nr:PREDICTED: exocyst complex component EXO70A1-like [Nicotiana attenuata]OIT40755.1 exocyst complex component exo70a1 [Nicotiana attenuata]
MAILDNSKREASSPSTPRRAKKSLFSFSKTNSSLSNYSSHLPPPTPSHTLSQSIMEENIDNAETIIKKWDPKESSFEKFISLFQEDRKEAKEFIQCVKDLKRAMHFLVMEHSTSNKLVLAHNLMQTAMKRLEKEFYQILSTNKEHLDPESVSKSSQSSHLSQSISVDSQEDETGSENDIQAAVESISEVERLSVLAMSDLNLIADCMVGSGYAKECVKIYKIFRKSIVDEGLYRLGIESRSSAHINGKNSDALEHQVKHWINAVKVGVKTFFYGERFLCDHVFSTSNTIRETCFTDIAKEGGINLFRFPEVIAKSKKSPENIFLLMDLHETISELLPEIESIFSYESISTVKMQALSILHKLKASIQTTLSDFESSIQKNSLRTPVPGGGIHPLTNSALDYVCSLANYSGVLSDIICDSAPAAQSPFPESYFDSPSANETPTSAVSARLAWIILVLLCKLDSKAKLYNDIALSYLFLANNLQFVIEKVRKSVLKCLLGDDWISKLERKVKLYATNYENVAWNKVFLCLPESLDPSVSPDIIKEHFRKFNTAFDESYQKQKSWVVPDGKLRDEIKVSIARKLVPAYRDFYDYYMIVLSGEKNLEVLVRFSPDNIGNYLSDLFHETLPLGSLLSASTLPNSCVWHCLS